MIAVPEKLEGLFEFERDLLPDLKRIPMVVRYKLDLVGLKVSLTAWNRLSLGVRKQLITEWPVRTHAERAALKEWLINWLRTTSTRPLREFVLQDPPWEDRHHLPEAIAAAAAPCTPPLTLAEWSDLELLQRFALVKLARRHGLETANGLDVCAMAEAGNEVAGNVLAQYTDAAAEGIVELAMLLDLDTVAVGGAISRQRKLFVQPLRDKVNRRLPRCRVAAAAFTNDAGIIGAAELG